VLTRSYLAFEFLLLFFCCDI